MSAILTHPRGLSLVTLPSTPTGFEVKQEHLALPSRFPAQTTPQVTVSPSSGHSFLWAKSSSLVWEYDARGRRIGEMQVGKGVRSVVAIGKSGHDEGKQRVAVGGEGVWKVMEKGSEGKWTSVKDYQVEGRVERLAASQDGRYVAVAVRGGLVTSYNLEMGTSEDVGLSADIVDMVFPSSSPRTLVIATADKLHIHSLRSDGSSASANATRTITSFCAGQSAVLSLAVSPSSNARGQANSPICAVLGQEGRLALIHLDEPEIETTLINLEQGLTGLTFLNDITLVGATSSGGMVTMDIRNPQASAAAIPLNEPVLAVHVLPQISKAPRSSVAPSLSSSRRSILGESRHLSNAPTPPIAIALSAGKGKQAVRTSDAMPRSRSEVVVSKKAAVPASSSLANLRGEMGRASSGSKIRDWEEKAAEAPKADGGRSVSVTPLLDRPGATSRSTSPTTLPPLRSASPVTKPPITTSSSTRVVSAPSTSSLPTRSAAASSSRSVSFGHTRSRESTGPPPTHTAYDMHALMAADAIREEDDEEVAEAVEAEQAGQGQEQEQDDFEGEDEDLHLEWAMAGSAGIRAPRPQHESLGAAIGSGSSEEVVYLRREMARMQLDMLRMNRDLKEQIKLAVLPLSKKLDGQRELLGMQQREIDRLRCRGAC